MTPDVAVVFGAVVLARFVVPLLIPRYPLPALLACLVLDGVDQTIFQAFGFDPPGYQGYDKAMDVYYLAIAYISTLRNWTSGPAFEVSRFLFFFRMVGVVAFGLSHWRALLLIFPNTFEYFFIAYEAVRARWSPTRLGARAWILVAAGIWVVVKLPQEWWIHVAQLDVTDTMQEVPWFTPALVVAVLALAIGFWVLVRPRLPPPDWHWRVRPDPVPAGIATPAEVSAWRSRHSRVLSGQTLEKVVMVGLLSVSFAQVLPGLRTSNTELFVGLGVLIVINTAIGLWVDRGARALESLAAAIGVRVVFNIGLVVLAEWLFGPGTDLRPLPAAFFIVLLSLLTTLHDRYQPVHEVRMADVGATGGARAAR